MKKQTKLKILELCHYSAGGCGVWARVRQESQQLIKKGYEVRVFSSNFEKGTDKLVCSEENLGGIKIKRFSAKKLGGESFMKWNFEKEALDYSPDIIIAHNYRQIHTTKALNIAKKLRAEGKKVKVFLVTHAPFVEGNITRSFLSKLAVGFYDRFIGPKTLHKFDKIIVISHWEIPYILGVGAKKEKIIYLPNGIPQEFFVMKKQAKEENKILFLGRISPIKNIEIIIRAMNLLQDKNIVLELVGPAEKNYKKQLEKLILENNLENRIKFLPAIYEFKRKIAKLDSAKLFVLSSKKEGMPQSLIEAMARGKVVLGSNIPAISDLIKNGKNGFLFESNDPHSLANMVDKILKINNSKIQENARSFAKQFDWKIVIKKLESLF